MKQISAYRSYNDLSIIVSGLKKEVVGSSYRLNLSHGPVDFIVEKCRDGKYVAIRFQNTWIYKLESQDYGDFLGKPYPVGICETEQSALEHVLFLEKYCSENKPAHPKKKKEKTNSLPQMVLVFYLLSFTALLCCEYCLDPNMDLTTTIMYFCGILFGSLTAYHLVFS